VVVTFNEILDNVTLGCFVCDVLARAFVMNFYRTITQWILWLYDKHSWEGLYVNKKMTLLMTGASLCTDGDVKAMTDGSHPGLTPLHFTS
jgi:hypothetical protein